MRKPCKFKLLPCEIKISARYLESRVSMLFEGRRGWVDVYTHLVWLDLFAGHASAVGPGGRHRVLVYCDRIDGYALKGPSDSELW